MFTGLVEEIAVVKQISKLNQSARLVLQAKTIMSDMHLGDSISVNGICLTVTNFGADWFSVDAVPETMRRSNLGRLQAGSSVNVERAMRVDARFGGHIVSGHIDGTGVLTHRHQESLAVVLRIDTSADVLKYVVSKGSICINGVSLTVMDVDDRSFSVSIIPHTGGQTTLLDSRIGEVVNLECDIVGKYVEKLLQGGYGTKGTTSPEDDFNRGLNHLRQHGFA